MGATALAYIIVCVILMIIDGILMTQLDALGLWNAAFASAIVGMSILFLSLIPLVIPGLIAPPNNPALLYVLVSCGMLKVVLCGAWLWAVKATYTARDLEALKLRIRFLNALLGAGVSTLVAPFLYEDPVAFGISCLSAISLLFMGVSYLKRYFSRRDLLERVLSSLGEWEYRNLAELVVKLRIPDHVLRDILYELWQYDLVDLFEVGTLLYVRRKSGLGKIP